MAPAPIHGRPRFVERLAVCRRTLCYTLQRDVRFLQIKWLKTEDEILPASNEVFRFRTNDRQIGTSRNRSDRENRCVIQLGPERLKFFCRHQFWTTDQPFVLDAGQENRAKSRIAHDMVRDVLVAENGWTPERGT